jgi:hypothetical protein
MKNEEDFFRTVLQRGEQETLEVGKLPGALLLGSRSRK